MAVLLTGLKYEGYPQAVNLWITTATLSFIWRGKTYHIPSGFVCDFYSIPRLFRFWRANNRGYGNEPAVIHDFLLRFRDHFGLGIMDCHRAFRDFMELLNFGQEGRLKYKAVVLGGWTCPGSGDGTPPRKERRAMRLNGHSWSYYRDKVARANLPDFPS